MPGSLRRRRFDAQFKLDAIRLIQDTSRTVRDIAKDLDVRPELLYRWQRELEQNPEQAFPGKGKLKPEQDRIRQLEQELARVKQERDILKKALAYFSRNER
jgi:transposase